jgi:uroporphyrin-III C-methyltransferase
MNETEKQELEPATSDAVEAASATAEEQVEPNTHEESAAGTAREQDHPDSSSASSGLPLVIALIALVVALAGVGLGYMKWVELTGALQQERQAVVQLRGQQQETKGRLDESGKTMAAQQAAFAAQDDMLKQERSRLQQQSAEMQASLEKVFQRVARSSTEWVVAEAEYLMRIANHRLQLEGDAATAQVALETADGRLRDSGDPAWTGVRERLAREITQLQSVKVLDLAGHASRLSGLISEVEKLELPHTGPIVSARSEPDEKKTGEFSVDRVLHDGWEGFKSLMVIRQNDQPLTAMLGPEQRFFLYQNLRLQLEAARLALLRQDQALYDSSLERATSWVAEFFDREHPSTRAMQEGIGGLNGVQVQPALPDISGSLRLLLEQRRSIGTGQKAGS